MNVDLVQNWLCDLEDRTTFLHPQFSQLENGHSAYLSTQRFTWHVGVLSRAILSPGEV